MQKPKCSRGLFCFAQRAIPLLVKTVATQPTHPPTLIVTGATASIRGGARFSTFASGKFSQRGLVQSLAREFAHQGVHVAYAIIDGGIKWPSRDWTMNGGAEDGMLRPDAVSFFILAFTENGNGLTKVFVDCGELLALAHAAPLGFHAGDGPTTIH